MTKRMMLLAITAVSAALFALPAVASANWNVDPINQSFTGSSDAGFVGNLTATGFPKITCEGPSTVTGQWSNGTDGTFTLVASKCHTSVFGFTIGCETAGSAVTNTIKAAGSFKNVTIAADASGRKRGITVTPADTIIECPGIPPIKVSGRVIGRITGDPAPSPSGCGVVDSEFTLEFLTAGGVQTPLRTDSMSSSESDDLTAQTGSSAPVTAALEDKQIIKTPSATTWTCH